MIDVLGKILRKRRSWYNILIIIFPIFTRKQTACRGNANVYNIRVLVFFFFYRQPAGTRSELIYRTLDTRRGRKIKYYIVYKKKNIYKTIR